jgi:hypothetical protein
VLVASASEDEHEEHLCTLLQHFSEYGVLLNPAKCVFGAEEVAFLGYSVSAAGTRPLEEKVAALNRFQQPCLSQRAQTFPWYAQFLSTVHTTSRWHTSATSCCLSWSQGQRATTGGLDTLHGPGFRRLQCQPPPCCTSGSSGPICDVSLIYRHFRYFDWHRLATACMRRLAASGLLLA